MLRYTIILFLFFYVRPVKKHIIIGVALCHESLETRGQALTYGPQIELLVEFYVLLTVHLGTILFK